MSSTAPEAPPPLLQLVIRFSTSNPDLILTLTEDLSTTSILTLKQQIRAELPSPASESRLRLIHSGRVLQDITSLDKALGAAAHPPPPLPSTTSKAQGKLPLRDPSTRIYIHCSIGDTLTPAELSTEKQSAQEADATLATASTTNNAQTASTSGDGDDGHADTTSTIPAPRGFDRLLSTGFTPAEVTQLRSQFLAIQSHTHTPDTMPTGPTLLELEERWLDNGQQFGGGGEGSQQAASFGSEDAGGLEDMLYGNLVGFFWPIAAVCWLGREEGVWSQRRRIAVLSGFLVNLTFGFLRSAN